MIRVEEEDEEQNTKEIWDCVNHIAPDIRRECRPAPRHEGIVSRESCVFIHINARQLAVAYVSTASNHSLTTIMFPCLRSSGPRLDICPWKNIENSDESILTSDNDPYEGEGRINNDPFIRETIRRL